MLSLGAPGPGGVRDTLCHLRMLQALSSLALDWSETLCAIAGCSRPCPARPWTSQGSWGSHSLSGHSVPDLFLWCSTAGRAAMAINLTVPIYFINHETFQPNMRKNFCSWKVAELWNSCPRRRGVSSEETFCLCHLLQMALPWQGWTGGSPEILSHPNNSVIP